MPIALFQEVPHPLALPTLSNNSSSSNIQLRTEVNLPTPVTTLDRGATAMLIRTTNSKEHLKTMVIINNTTNPIINSNNTSTLAAMELNNSTTNSLNITLNHSTIVTINTSNSNSRPLITGKKKPPLVRLLNNLPPNPLQR